MEIVLFNIRAVADLLEEHMWERPTIFMSDALYAELKIYLMDRSINILPDEGTSTLFGFPIEIVDGLGKKEYAVGYKFEAKKPYAEGAAV